MDPERWRTFEALYHEALKTAPAERGAFLQHACQDDDELRREVESLLAQEGSSEGFLEEPAFDVAARLVAGDGPYSGGSDPVAVNTVISHFRVVGKLGMGGMGVVYRGEDISLGRPVALKFLPVDAPRDPQSLERFRREARSASTLNHPNICTIYEVAEFQGQPFFAMELLEGQTLQQRIARGRLENEELLQVAVQIADGLEAAHAKGLIHRDIKPSNIYLLPRGQVKILDFGLAKKAGPTRRAEAGPLEATATLHTDDGYLTRPGTTIGTVAYMSPEQARAEELDARSDLFSFGAVLYEMASGKAPFSGASSAVIFDAILNRKPAPPQQYNPALPETLIQIIDRALEKTREARYQSAAEMGADLRRLKRDSESGRLSALSPARLGAAPAPRVRTPWKIAVAIVAVTLIVAGGVYYRSHQRDRLTDKDSIVLSDFDNKTGDSVFDDTLKQGLSVQLEQSPFLFLVSENKINQTMKLMGRPPGERLTPELAREVCQRTGNEATLTGSIAGLGSQYVIGLKAVNCASGDVLAEAQEQAAGKELVLKALDSAAVSLRSKLGESLGSVQKYATPLEEATTPSLEALQAYSLGVKALVERDDNRATVSLTQQAVRLDPNFGMAYALLGVGYQNLGETTLAAEYTRKAYELRERVSEREKFQIESVYYDYVTGNVDKARQVYELWAQTYPRDDVPPTNLSVMYLRLGQYDRSLAEAREAIRLDPASGNNYVNLFTSYFFLNRLDETQAAIEEAQSKNLDTGHLHFIAYRLAFLRNNVAGMAQQVAWAAGKPGVEDVMLVAEADTVAYSGRLGKARELSRRAVASALHAEEKETAAGYEASAALREALFGNSDQGRQRVAAALKLSNGRDVQYQAALALAFMGDAARAQALANDLSKRYPEDTIVQFMRVPTLNAQLALNRNDAAKAIEALQAAAPYELGMAAGLEPAYVRGQAYLAPHQGSQAEGEFRKIIEHRVIVLNSPIGALARLGIARAYVLQGDTVKAKAAYQDFLTLWKDSDAEIPILKQAKAEYARLR